MKGRRVAKLLMLNQCGLRGRFARRIGLTLSNCPYKGKTGTGREQADAWRDGWKDEDREIWLDKELRLRGMNE